MWSNKAAESKGLCPGRQVLGPLLLLILTPPLSVIIWYNLVKQDGSLTALYDLFKNQGVFAFNEIYPSWEQILAQWKLVAAFSAFELVLMKVLPGKKFHGPVSPAGHVPEYKQNGVPAYVVSVLTYFAISYYGIYKPGTAFNQLGPLYSFLSIASFGFCFFLYIKGLFFPSGPDHGSSGNIIIDFFWGTELYPRVLGWDIKTFTNCRFGLMAWAILIIDYAGYQYHQFGYVSDALVVSVALQHVYLFKFYWWESGYWSSLDIMHDRAGYYICWGCLVWVPSVYTSGSMYLAAHPVTLGFSRAVLFFALGVLMIWINYDCDRQRQQFRQNKGKYKIWGKDAEYLVAHYTTEKGEKKESLLLCSGYWGVSRHFHYVPEILASLFWCVPVHTQSMPYFYVIYLTFLLIDRSVRDDYRCQHKYGKKWEEYCRRVPYRILPPIF